MIYPMPQEHVGRSYGFLNSHKLNYYTLLFLIFSLLLLPSLPLPGLPSVRLDDIIIFSWILIIFPFLKTNLNNIAIFRIYFFISLGLLLPISIANGLINGYGGDFADLNQYIRYLKYGGIYLLAFYVFNSIDAKGSKKIIEFIFSFCIVLSIIALSQYFNFLNLNEQYVTFVAPTQYETLVGDHLFPRPVGMIGNPNELAFIFVLIFLLSVYYCREYGANILCICTAVFLLIGLFLTMSRGGVIGMIAGLLLMCLHFLKHSSAKINIKILFFGSVFVAMLFAILTYPPVFDEITWRLVMAQDLSTDDSWLQRLESWEQNLSIIAQHYLIGVGPLRRIELLAADNEWILIIRSYGLIGVMLFICFMALPLINRTSGAKKALNLGIVGATFLYMIPTVAFHSLVIFPLILIIFAFVDSKASTPLK